MNFLREILLETNFNNPLSRVVENEIPRYSLLPKQSSSHLMV